jgi:outer membrane receptor protein involved in Fe transport
MEPAGRPTDARINSPVFGLLLAACVHLCASAVQAAEGRIVTGSDGRPVADAEVAILGRTGTVRTDADGRFRWTPDPRPPFEVLIVLPGGGYVKPILVEELPEGVLVLRVTPALEESIMVVAGTAPSVEAAPANGVTSVPKEDLRGRQPVNVAQALENVAGTAAVSEGQAAVPSVRGFVGGRTLILVDGARVTAERRVGASATYVDPASLEGIEISRGPGSVAYGSDAFGGVIQLRTRRAQPGTPLSGRFSGSAGVGTLQQRASLELARGFDRGGAILQGHWRNFDDWRSPEGEVFNSGAEDRGFLAGFDHVLAGGLASVGWQSDFGRDIGRPRDNSRTVRFFYPVEDSHRLTLRWERGSLAGLSRAGATAFLGSYAVVTDQDRFATPSRPRSVERADVSARDFQVRLFAEKALGRTRVDAGLDVNGRFGLEAHDIAVAYDSAGAVAATTDYLSVADARRIDAGAYVQAEAAPVSTLVVAVGARGDRVTASNRGGHFGDHSEANGALSGYASVSVGPLRGFSATVQAARGFRDPTLSDRYYRGPTGRGFITGNPALGPERSAQLDLAVRYVSARWRLALYGYHYRISRLVERYEGEPDFFFFRNRGRARVRGVEAELQASLPWKLGVEATAHALEGRALDDGTALDAIPVPTLTVRVRRDVERAYGWVRGAVYGNLDDPGPTEQERPSHALVDAGLGIHLGRSVELDLVGRNLLDEAYRVSPDSRATLAAGRAAVATVTVRF